MIIRKNFAKGNSLHCECEIHLRAIRMENIYSCCAKLLKLLSYARRFCNPALFSHIGYCSLVLLVTKKVRRVHITQFNWRVLHTRANIAQASCCSLVLNFSEFHETSEVDNLRVYSLKKRPSNETYDASVSFDWRYSITTWSCVKIKLIAVRIDYRKKLLQAGGI